MAMPITNQIANRSQVSGVEERDQPDDGGSG